MTPADIWSYAESLPNVQPTFPFDETTLVLKIAHLKLFCIIPLDAVEHSPQMALKFPSKDLEELRSQYGCLFKASYLHSAHWSAVALDGSEKPAKLQQWVRQSYNLVLAGMTKNQRTTHSLTPLEL